MRWLLTVVLLPAGLTGQDPTPSAPTAIRRVDLTGAPTAIVSTDVAPADSSPCLVRVAAQELLAAYRSSQGIALARSRDGGQSWAPLPSPTTWRGLPGPAALHAVVVDGSMRLALFTAEVPPRCGVSDDLGGTWSALRKVTERPLALAAVCDLGPSTTMALLRPAGPPGTPALLSRADTADGGLQWRPAHAWDGAPALADPMVALPGEPGARAALLGPTTAWAFDAKRGWSKPARRNAALPTGRVATAPASNGRVVLAHATPATGALAAWVVPFDDLEQGRGGHYRLDLPAGAGRLDPQVALAWSQREAFVLLAVEHRETGTVLRATRFDLEQAEDLLIPDARTHYHGREIAQTMHWKGAGWLVRQTREREENAARMLDALGVEPGQTVCDFGAGNGFHTLPIARRVGPEGAVYAVDIQVPMLRMLRTRAEREGLGNIERVLGLFDDPLLPPASCDLILLADVYHELGHPERVLTALRTALRPGGRIALLEFRGEDPEVPIKKLHKMTKAQILTELKANGLALVEEFDELPWQHLMFFARAAKR